MQDMTGEIHHAISFDIKQVGRDTHIKKTYVSLPVELEIPSKGRCKQQVICGKCQKTLDIVVYSSLTNTIWSLITLIPILSGIVVGGWYFTSLGDAAIQIYWLGMAAIFGVGGWVAWWIICSLTLGADPSARVVGENRNHALADHVAVVSKSVTKWRTPWQYMLLMGTIICSLVLGLFFHRYQFGIPIDGDRLVALLGKQVENPVVQRAFHELGHQNVRNRTEQAIRWNQHHLEVAWNAEGIHKITFGRHTSIYSGTLPKGLSPNDNLSDAKEKLGIESKDDPREVDNAGGLISAPGIMLWFIHGKLGKIVVRYENADKE